MTKEQILKEFEQKFSSRSTIDLNLFPDVTEFISKAIDQTREETIKEILKEIPVIYENTDGVGYDFMIALEELLNKLKN